MACDKARVLLLIQLVWFAARGTALSRNTHCQPQAIVKYISCNAGFKSEVYFCSSLNLKFIFVPHSKASASLSNCPRADTVSPRFLFYYSLFLFWGCFWMLGYEIPSPQSPKFFLKNTSLYLVPSYYNNSHLRNIINTQLNRVLFQSPLSQ